MAVLPYCICLFVYVQSMDVGLDVVVVVAAVVGHSALAFFCQIYHGDYI